MPTVDLAPVYRAMRLRALTHRATASAPALAELLPGGLSEGQPPEGAPYPYGVLRLYNLRDTRGTSAARYGVTAEVLLYGQGRTAFYALEAAADVCTAALVGWRDGAAGVVLVTGGDRDTLPAFSESADPTVIGSRLVFDLVLYPPAPH